MRHALIESLRSLSRFSRHRGVTDSVPGGRRPYRRVDTGRAPGGVARERDRAGGQACETDGDLIRGPVALPGAAHPDATRPATTRPRTARPGAPAGAARPTAFLGRRARHGAAASGARRRVYGGRDSGRGWPGPDDPPSVLLVARTHAARAGGGPPCRGAAFRHWQAPAGALDLDSVVLVADAPGRLPRPPPSEAKRPWTSIAFRGSLPGASARRTGSPPGTGPTPPHRAKIALNRSHDGQMLARFFFFFLSCTGIRARQPSRGTSACRHYMLLRQQPTRQQRTARRAPPAAPHGRRAAVRIDPGRAPAARFRDLRHDDHVRPTGRKRGPAARAARATDAVIASPLYWYSLSAPVSATSTTGPAGCAPPASTSKATLAGRTCGASRRSRTRRRSPTR